MKQLITKQLVTADEIITELWDIGSLMDIIDELYWSGGYESKPLIKFVMEYADEHGYVITDEDELDRLLYDAYNCAEKGLS